MLIGNQIKNYGAGDPRISVDEVKESLRREMVAEFLEMNTGTMGMGTETKESLRREMISGIIMGAGQDTIQYLREEMAAEIKAALKEESARRLSAGSYVER